MAHDRGVEDLQLQLGRDARLAELYLGHSAPSCSSSKKPATAFSIFGPPEIPSQLTRTRPTSR